MPRTVAASRISRPSPRTRHPESLPPFAMWPAFPTADYYGGSVALGLAPRRRSPALGAADVRARRRRPVRPLVWPRWPSLAGRRNPVSMRPTPLVQRPRTQAWWSGAGCCTLGTGIQAIQLSPYRASLAGLRPTRLRPAPAFPACCGPRWLSPRGQPGGSRACPPCSCRLKRQSAAQFQGAPQSNHFTT